MDVSERTKKTVVVFGFVFSGGEGAGRLPADGTHNYFLVVSKKTVVVWVDFGVASRIQSETDQDARSVMLGQRSKDRYRATTVVEKGIVYVYGQFLCVRSDTNETISAIRNRLFLGQLIICRFWMFQREPKKRLSFLVLFFPVGRARDAYPRMASTTTSSLFPGKRLWCGSTSALR